MIYKIIIMLCCISSNILWCANSTIITPTRITTPSNTTVRLGDVLFAGTAPNPSRMVILIDGVHAGEILTNNNGSNNWKRSIFINAIGTHTAQALAYYNGADIPIASEPVSFTVAGPLLALTMQPNTTGSTVRSRSALNYMITITNTSIIDVTDLIITATLSEGLQYIFGHLSNEGPVIAQGNSITGQIGTLPVGETVTLTLNTFVSASVNSSVSSTVAVNSSNGLPGQLANTLVVK